VSAGRSLVLAEIPRRTPAWLTDADDGPFGTGLPTHSHTRAELDKARARVAATDRRRAAAELRAWTKAHR